MTELYKVTPKLYFTTESNATNREVLSRYRITHILSTLGPAKIQYENITYAYVTLEDSIHQHLTPSAIRAVKWIHNAIVNNGTVVVYCRAAHSRSVSIVMAYLILNEQSSYKDALERVRMASRYANPNPKFVTELKDMDRVAKYTRETC